MVISVKKLAGHFQDTVSWKALVAKTLGAENFEEALVRYSEDNIPLGPLFTQDDTVQSSLIPATHIKKQVGRPWHITTLIDHPDIKHANVDILADLKGGASALSLNIDPSGKHGIAVRDTSDLQRLFADVHTTLVPLDFTQSHTNFATTALFAAHFKAHKNFENIHLNLGYTYTLGHENELRAICHWVRRHTPHWKAISINGVKIHEAGASPAQELAYIISHAVAVIKLLKQEHNIEDIYKLIDVHLACDQDAHQGIIKFRAARLLWAKIAQEFGLSPHQSAVNLHATSSKRMLATTDPWTNMLRLNSACFGAVCGGADYITVLPFTHSLGLATPFARRIARNMQILQMEETHLGHVQDPANGSYMHENLTHSLAQKAWEIFQHMEGLGGWSGAQDWFWTNVKSMDHTRRQKINNGDILRVGVNQFVKPDVRKAEVLPRPAIKLKTGNIIDTDDFDDAVQQALNGYLVPAGMS